MSSINININDHSSEVLGELHRRIPVILNALAIEAEGNTITEVNALVYDAPISESGYIRTGRLKGSISHAHDNDYAYIGTNLEYAPYVEFGTYRMKARPFIKNAVTKTEYLNKYKSIIEDGLK